MRDSIWSLPSSSYDEDESVPHMRTESVLGRAFKAIPGDTWGAKLSQCSSCNCCVRHKKNKPSQLSFWVELPFQGTQDHECGCNCRHMARFICRQIGEDGRINPGMPPSEEPE